MKLIKGTHVYIEKKESVELSIFLDDSNDTNPIKDWESMGQYVCFHRRYDLGNNKDFKGPEELNAYLEDAEVFDWPLYLYDHSGLTLSLGSGKFRACDPVGWDWGKLGYVFVTHEQAREEFPETTDFGELEQRVYECLVAEVEEYNKYLHGECYGYVLEDKEKELESCWGFLGYDAVLTEAKTALENYLTHGRRQLELPGIGG